MFRLCSFSNFNGNIKNYHIWEKLKRNNLELKTGEKSNINGNIKGLKNKMNYESIMFLKNIWYLFGCC